MPRQERQQGKAGRQQSKGQQADAGHAIPNPIQVQKFLGGLDYPVGKQDILDKARSEGADDNVMEALERIPDEEYASPVDISRQIGKLE
jgi:hypothetical protein